MNERASTLFVSGNVPEVPRQTGNGTPNAITKAIKVATPREGRYRKYESHNLWGISIISFQLRF